MGIKNRGGSFHPSRKSGIAKFNENLALKRELEKPKPKPTFEPLDISKPDWSKGRPHKG